MQKFFKRRNRTSDDRDDRESAMEIGHPTNVSHDCHVGFDPERGTFTGLPVAWAQWLHDANIRYDSVFVSSFEESLSEVCELTIVVS